MMFRRVMRRLLLAGLAAAACLAALPGGARAASVPGWRIVWTDHVTGPSTFVASSATVPGDAWIGGVPWANSTPSRKPPLYHWNCHARGAAKLPSRLTLAILFYPAAASPNVLAFGEDDPNG